MWLFFQQRTDLFDGHPKKMLHVSPEPQFAERIAKAKYIDYVSADLEDPRAMVQMDITDIQYPDNTFDVVYCSHVLEHVTDDVKAMVELHRVTRPGGWAVLQVPITAAQTFEDPSAITAEARTWLFGHPDHVRNYGPDYIDRLTAGGFSVNVVPFARQLDNRLIRRYGLPEHEDIYFCQKELQISRAECAPGRTGHDASAHLLDGENVLEYA
jgi:SAM-dependent methyltransferase